MGELFQLLFVNEMNFALFSKEEKLKKYIFQAEVGEEISETDARLRRLKQRTRTRGKRKRKNRNRLRGRLRANSPLMRLSVSEMNQVRNSMI